MTFEILRQVLVKAFQDAEAEPPVDIYDPRHPVFIAALFGTGFCGLLRPGELVKRKTSKGIQTAPLLRRHFVPTPSGAGSPSSRNPQYVGCHLRVATSKTDQFGERSDRELGDTKDEFVNGPKWLPRMLELRDKAGEVYDPDAPLFLTRDPKTKELRAATYDDLSEWLQHFLARAGYDTAGYKGHSFRIGAATSLAMNGVPTAIIEDMGGWSRGSLSLPRYIRGFASARILRSMASFFARPFVQPEAEAAQTDAALRMAFGIGSDA